MSTNKNISKDMTFEGWYDRLHRKFRDDEGGYVDVVDCLPKEAQKEDRGTFVVSVTFVPKP